MDRLVFAIIVGLILLVPVASAPSNTTNVCYDSRVLGVNKTTVINVNGNITNIISSENVTCAFGCDGVNRQCRPSASFMTMEAFIILFAVAISLVGLSYVFDQIVMAIGGGGMMLGLGFALFQGVEMGGFVLNTSNFILMPVFSMTLIALSFYIMLKAGISAWNGRKAEKKP